MLPLIDHLSNEELAHITLCHLINFKYFVDGPRAVKIVPITDGIGDSIEKEAYAKLCRSSDFLKFARKKRNLRNAKDLAISMRMALLREPKRAKKL